MGSSKVKQFSCFNKKQVTTWSQTARLAGNATKADYRVRIAWTNIVLAVQHTPNIR
jgi:hypothetical protein